MAAQEELAEAEVDGTVADGLVTVTVNGTGELVGVKIRADSFDPADTEDLEDLIVAAYRDAAARADALAAEKLGPLAGGARWRSAAGPRRRAPACRSGSGPARAPMYEGVVQDLIDELGRLPGVGPKSAQRIAFHLLAGRPGRRTPARAGAGRGQGAGPVLLGLRQRRRGGDLPDLPRPAPRPVA